jgi:hypothetical protein
MVLLGQHVELGSLGVTSSWSPLCASSGTPIWALYTKCSLQTHILTVQWIKFQLLVKEYSPLPTREPSIQFYQSPLQTTQVNP